jgi:hypothetical protein
MIESTGGVIVYEYDFIENLAKTFSAELDEDILNNLIEIKKTNKFIRRKSPLRLSYKMTAADTWRKARENNDSDDNKNIKMLVSNLNKLSEINYAQITTKISDIFKEINSEEELEMFIQTICDKAVTENIYSNLYAQLVNDLSKLPTEKENIVGSIVYEFCNNFFGKFNNIEVEELNDINDYEKLCEIIKTKTQLIGGYVFIANLFKFDIVSYETVNKNYKYLVTLTEKAPSEYIGKYIDAIVSILSNCGSRLQSDNPNVFKENFMDICYKLCLKENNLIPKYRFKLMDICDKYENNWTVSDSDWNKV